MKKILILICFISFFTGCYDYQELNNLAIISGISIDYKENQYDIMYEILNSKKGEGKEEESKSKTYYVEGMGTTIEEAFLNANFKVSKEAYFSHLKVVIFSEEVSKHYLDGVLDYFIRNPNIRNIFVPLIAVNMDAKEILQTTTTENPVCSEAIRNMIEMNKGTENIAINQDYETFMDQILDPRKDALLNTITKENDTILLLGIGAFQKSTLKTTLNETEASTLNVLNNTSYHKHIKIPCNTNSNKYTTLDFYDNTHTNISLKEQTLFIQSNLEANIIEDDCHYDFRETKNYAILEEKAKTEIEKEYKQLFNKLQTYQTDILKINDTIYKQTRKELTNWYTLPISYEIMVDINKNGLVFGVKNNE